MKSRFSQLSKYSAITLSAFALTGWVVATTFSSPELYISQPGGYPLPEYKPKVATVVLPVDTPGSPDSLKYPFEDRMSDPMSMPYDHSPLYLNDPSNIKTNIEYDPDNNQYNINEMIGGEFYRNPSYLTYEEYVRKTNSESTKKYWKQLADGGNSITGKKGINPRIYVGSEVFERIFGTNTIDIRPQGSAELTFGANIATNKNPGIPVKQQRTATFDFKEKIQLNVVGNIGDKMKLSTNYNTEASFDFENKMKLEYTGHDDEIIKKIEAGNVSLPLTGTLITGSQSLFGFKAQLQFGKVMVTGLFSEQKGQSQSIVVPPGGGQKNDFEITCDNYEANKHFFLAQYFRDNYDQALKNAPVVSTPISITKLEVWVVKPGLTDTRSLIGFMDLGEISPYSNSDVVKIGNAPIPTNPLPDNNANQLYYNFNDPAQPYVNLRNPSYANTTQIYNTLAADSFLAPRDYERIENAVKLQPSEYTYDALLGYVSLKSQLNPNQVLAVAYEYSYNGQVHRVGDLTTAGINPPNRLYVKILKSSNVSVKLPTWKLMMKNIYALGAYGLQQKDFKLDVLYYNDSTGSDINFLPAGASEPKVNSIPLIKVLNLDRLNSQLDPQPDGIFDFVEGLTINTADGRVIFPAVEPFGSYLKSKFNPNTLVYQKFVFQELYDSSKTAAQQLPEKNKFKIKGSYVSNVSSDISLNAINIPQGSVKVTAGGIPLTENVDYTVDYNLGRVKIINQSYLNSASPINISLESNSLFSIQSKRLMGLHVDYLHSKDFTLGGTVLNLTERPLTQKINIGDEPISNTIIGVDGNYRTDSRFITKLVDKLPFIATKEVSNVSVNAEYAHFFPGHPKVIGQSGTAYIDDFEGTQSNIDLTTAGSWYLASVPQNQPNLFPETNSSDNRVFGANRAKLAWYQVDPTVFYHKSSINTVAYNDYELQNNQVREVFDNEIFPNKDYPNGIVPPLRVLNLSYYPGERGPYNYDVAGVPGMTAGIGASGNLLNPESRWGGIMRHLETNDFEAANVEFITFWLMDPFNEDNPKPNNKGKLYFNLGQVSEDILHDGQRMYENGLPSSTLNSQTAKTDWGFYPTNTTNPTNAFDNDPTSRTQQDIGFDGLRDNAVDAFSTVNEHNFIADSSKRSFLDSIAFVFGGSSGAYTLANTDPSSDNFRFFRGNTTSDTSTSILFRYKDYNGTEANSPVASGSYSQSSTNLPDAEDISRDNNMDIYENYFQYEVEIDPNKMALGSQKYITDRVVAPVSSTINPSKKVVWYQFKIPVSDFTKQVGDIQDFKSIGYIRMFMKGFSEPMVLRFGKLDLSRGEWRRYQAGVAYGCDAIDPIPPFSSTTFDVGAVSIEENSGRTPINYVVPPGITRELNASTQQAQQLNEQSLSMRVCELFDGDGRAAYKNTEIDLRTYKRIKMYVHCESILNQPEIKDNDLTVFIRIGSDLTENFYEYELPLKVSPLYNNNPTSIWPEANNVDIELAKLLAAKEMRQQALLDPSTGITVKTFYPVMRDGEATIYVVGTPNLAEARSIMIGIRNPKQGCPQFTQYNNDDGFTKCAEVWVNELRLTDFDEQGGWAANARIVTKLANLGTLALSGRRSTYGFGMIEQKITERSYEDVTAYSILSQLNLGKFFPDKWGIAIPFGFEYGEEFIKPKYDPLQPDVLFQSALDAEKANGDPDEFKRNRIDYTKRKGFNFSNVQKTRTSGGKSHLWDIENFNFTYAFTEVYHRNIDIQYDILKNHLAMLGYNFNASPKNWQPFKNSKSLNSKWLKLIKDFNVTPLPSSLNFNTSQNRQYGETLLRNNTAYQALIDTTFNKFWNWTRTYDIKWDLTKSIKLDFNALNTSKVDEPNGRIDTEEKKKIVRTNFWNGGRNTDYRQSGNASWQVPLSKIPALDWIQVNLRYGFDYSWMAAPSILDSVNLTLIPNPILQNTIQNSNTKQFNGTVTFTQLYNKVPFFKRLLAPTPATPGGKTARPPKAETPKVPGDTAKTVKPKVPGQINPVVKFIGKMILSVKSAGLNYSETNGTAMPGYIPKTEFLGQDYNFKSVSGSTSNAPGFGFTFGSQADLRAKAARNNWLTTDTAFNSQYSQSYNQSFTGRSTVEPFDGMRIELSGLKNFTKSHTENYRINANSGEYNSYNALESGNFSISTIAWGTAFKKINKDYTNSTFDEFSKNRLIISQRLAADNPYSTGVDSAGYNDGYSGSSQEVISASFYAAYTGKDPASAKLDPLSLFPLPNWRITYDGFTKMKWSQKYFQNFQLTHSYRCTYNINSFNTNLQYADPFNTGHSPIRDLSNNFIPKYDIAQVSITESFGPLIGVDMTFKGKSQFNIRAEYKRDRNLSLTYTGIQLTEIRGNEFTFGTGYRISKLKLPFKFGGKKITLQNDLVLNFDFSYRKSLNVLRRMIEQTNIPSSGMETFGIKFDADYQINDRFDVRFYWDTTINKPLIATSYPNSNTAFGFSVRFTLSQ